MIRTLSRHILRTSFVLLLVSVAFLFLLTNKGTKDATRGRWFESSQAFAEIQPTFPADTPPSILGTNDRQGTLYDERGNELFYTCKSNHCEVTYPFEKQVNVKKIDLLFSGYFPQDEEDVLFRFGDWAADGPSSVRRCDLRSSLCTYYFTQSSQTVDNLTIVLRNAQFKHFGVQEIKFHEARPRGIFASLLQLFFVWPRTLASYVLYPLLFFVFILTPGTILGEWQVLLRKRLGLTGVISISIVSIALLALLSFILPIWVIQSTFALLAVAFVVYAVRPKSFTNTLLSNNTTPLLISIAAALFLSSVMYIRDFPRRELTNNVYDFYYTTRARHIQVPYGSYETDFIIPFQTAINFEKGGASLSEKIGTIYRTTDRTPLVPLLMIGLGKTFGANMFIYQMLIATISGLFVIAAYTLASLFVNTTKAAIVALILAFSHFFAFITLFTATKSTAIFFVLSSLVYLVNSSAISKPIARKYLIAGILMALAYLSHPFSLAYFVPALFFVIISNFTKKHKIAWIKPLVVFALPYTIAFAVWTLFSLVIGQYSNSIYWAVTAGRTWEESSQSIERGHNFSIGLLMKVLTDSNYWIDKMYNAIGMFFFYTPAKYKGTARIFDFSKTTLPGSIGVVASFAFLFGLAYSILAKLKRRQNLNLIKIVISFIVFPIVLTLMYQGFYNPMGLMWYLPGVVAFLFIFLGTFVSTRIFALLGFFIISESYYLLFVNDPTGLKRFVEFFGDKNPYLVILYLLISSIYVLLVVSNARQKKRSEK